MAQSDIVTVTLNPALDIATSASDIRPGPKLRCTAPRQDPGGGGINVSRAIRTLGGTSTPLVAEPQAASARHSPIAARLIRRAAACRGRNPARPCPAPLR